MRTDSSPWPNRAASSGDSGRASIVEILLGAALVAVVVLATLPWMLASLERARLARTAREVSEALDAARSAARRLGLRTVVAWDHTEHQLVRFVDLDGDGSFDRAHEAELGPPVAVRAPIELRGPDEPRPEGTRAIVGFPASGRSPLRGAIFFADGTALEGGAFRFADPRGNLLEVRIGRGLEESARIRKWRGGGDLPHNWSDDADPRRPWVWE